MARAQYRCEPPSKNSFSGRNGGEHILDCVGVIWLQGKRGDQINNIAIGFKLRKILRWIFLADQAGHSINNLSTAGAGEAELMLFALMRGFDHPRGRQNDDHLGSAANFADNLEQAIMKFGKGTHQR